MNLNLFNNNPGLNFAETDVHDGRLFLQAGGRVGINTTNPKCTLHIGDIWSDSYSPEFQIGDYVSLFETSYLNRFIMSINAHHSASSISGEYTYLEPEWVGDPSASGLVFAQRSGGFGDMGFWGRIWGTDFEPKSFPEDFTPILFLYPEGKVTIACQTPDAEFTVAGSIHLKAEKQTPPAHNNLSGALIIGEPTEHSYFQLYSTGYQFPWASQWGSLVIDLIDNGSAPTNADLIIMGTNPKDRIYFLTFPLV